MGLSLHVFGPAESDDDDPEEIAECDIGHYSDFGCFRGTIAAHMDAKRFPTLMEHSDSDGEWTLAEIPMLERELQEIGSAFRKLPPQEPKGAFEHTEEYREGAKSLYDCFHNVDGENLFEAILDLCAVARQHKRPLTFM
jgi:Immunity protein 70